MSRFNHPSPCAVTYALLAVALCCHVARAAPGDNAPPPDCLYPDVAAGSARLGTVRGDAPRSYFVRDAIEAPGCPNASAACQSKAFVVPGDEVVLSGTLGRYVCASFANGRGNVTNGWLSDAAVTVSPAAANAPALADWTGRWVGLEQRINIRANAAGELAIEGDATYGSRDPERVKRGAVNMGDISGTVKPVGDTAAFAMGDNGTLPYEQAGDDVCRVRLRRLGPYLAVADNNNCGGHNVSFSGVYRRGR